MPEITKGEKPITFNISITDIKELKYHIKEIPDDILSILDKEPIQLQYSFNFKTILKDNILKYFLVVKYSHPKLAPDDVLLELGIEFSFFIDILQNVIKKEKKMYFLDDELLATITGIAISTTRGIIVTKTFGKNINKFYLPIFNPEDFIKSFKAAQK